MLTCFILFNHITGDAVACVTGQGTRHAGRGKGGKNWMTGCCYFLWDFLIYGGFITSLGLEVLGEYRWTKLKPTIFIIKQIFIMRFLYQSLDGHCIIKNHMQDINVSSLFHNKWFMFMVYRWSNVILFVGS